MHSDSPPAFTSNGSPNAVLSQILCCPGCWGTLDWSQGKGACYTHCGASFPWHDGIWYAVVPDKSWRSVVQDTVALFMDFTANRDATVANTLLNPQKEIESYTQKHETERDILFKLVWRKLNIAKSSSILEVGAGDLRIAAWLWSQGYCTVALEPVPEFLRRNEYDKGIAIPKICGSATRLPFESGSWDVVFVNCSLHHLDNITPVVREMGRVLRPGGILLIVGEPYLPIFASESRLRQAIPDCSFDNGINEKQSPFSEYFKAMKAASLEHISAYVRNEDIRLPYHLEKIGVPRSWIVSRREVISGWRIHLEHRFTHGRTSLWGWRSNQPIPKPQSIYPMDYAFDPAVYILRRGRSQLVGIWKAFLDPSKVPNAIEIGVNDIFALRRGFTHRKRDPDDNVPYKWLMFQGAFFLRVDTGIRRLSARVKMPADGISRATALEAFQDDQSLGTVSITSLSPGKWTDVSWSLPAVEHRQVCEFRLRADTVTEQGGQAISVMFRRISIT